MLKTIKKNVQMRLDELIKYAFENNVKNKVYRSDNGKSVMFLGNERFETVWDIGSEDLFTVEIEEEITEDTVFDKYVVLLKGGIISTPFRSPVKAVMGGYYTNIESVYALIDGKLELIWEANDDE